MRKYVLCHSVQPHPVHDCLGIFRIYISHCFVLVKQRAFQHLSWGKKKKCREQWVLLLRHFYFVHQSKFLSFSLPISFFFFFFKASGQLNLLLRAIKLPIMAKIWKFELLPLTGNSSIHLQNKHPNIQLKNSKDQSLLFPRWHLLELCGHPSLPNANLAEQNNCTDFNN